MDAGKLRHGVKRPRSLRFDADHADAPVEPGRGACDQAAAADRDEDGVERRSAEAREVLFPFEADRSLAGDGLGRVVGVDR